MRRNIFALLGYAAFESGFHPDFHIELLSHGSDDEKWIRSGGEMLDEHTYCW
jgi:hypothetical protein